MQKCTKYYKAISYLEGLMNLPIQGDYMINDRNLNIYLKRMEYFLSCVGNPHIPKGDYNPKYIHITGTSGKGSVSNMLHEVLQVSGKCVGSFTSPFVTTTIEKIKVGELYISPDEFADILEEMKPSIDAAYTHGPYGRPSYFEIILAIGFIYFKRMKCEYVVLEVGCGGRYDATNVIQNPLATVITNISYDHRDILGNTLKEIAYEKMGIIKPHSSCYTAETRPELLKMFRKTCIEKKSSFTVIPKQPSYREANALLVTKISELCGISSVHIHKGIRRSFLQCRFEILQNNPLTVIDGAHNRSKIQSTIHNLKQLTYRKLILILGMADNKEHTSILKELIPHADTIFITRFSTKERKCAHPNKLLKLSRTYFKKNAHSEIFLDSHTALEKALSTAMNHDLILITGSFFLAGELRKRWISEEHILLTRKPR